MNKGLIFIASAAILLILEFGVISPMAVSAVQDVVNEKSVTTSEDWESEDWLVTSRTRDYYAWNMTNFDIISENPAETPLWEKVGPFTYEITTTREVIANDLEAGTLEYTSLNSYEWTGEGLDPSMEVSTMNIAYQTQVIAATPTAISAAMSLSKVGFTSNILALSMNLTANSMQVAQEFDRMISENESNGIQTEYYLANLALVANQGFMDQHVSTFGLQDYNLTFDNCLSLNQESGEQELQYDENTDELLCDGIADSDGDSTNETHAPTNTTWPSFSSNGTQLVNLFKNSVDPANSETKISLTDDLGPMTFMSFGEPEKSIAEIEADPENSTSYKRAAMYGYLPMTKIVDYGTAPNGGLIAIYGPDYSQLFTRDWTFYAAVGQFFLQVGGGIDWTTDPANYSSRLNTLIGHSSSASWFIDQDSTNEFLFGGDDTDEPTGILATSSSGTSFGLTNFLTLAESNPTDAMSAYGITDSDAFSKLTDWILGWHTDQVSLPLLLIGATDGSTINASTFVNKSFGGKNPIDLTPDDPDDDYISVGINIGGLRKYLAGGLVNINASVAGEILFGEMGLTTSAAVQLLYSELSGLTPPVSSQMLPTMNGYQYEFNDLIVAQSFGLTTNATDGTTEWDLDAARAVRYYLFNFMFGEFVPQYLADEFGSTQWTTRTVNEWLFGWHDPLVAFVDGDGPDDYSKGWASLELNATYYRTPELVAAGAEAVSNNPTTYVVYTGENNLSRVGQLVSENSGTELGGHTTAINQGTYGLVTVEDVLENTAGGFISGGGINSVDNPTVKYNLGGYIVADIPYTGKGTVHGIETLVYSMQTEPNRALQSNLLGTETLLDAMPGTVPVFFAADVSFHGEPVSGALIKGDVISTFYIDSRLQCSHSCKVTSNQSYDQDGDGIADSPTMDDLTPVFMTEDHISLTSSDADTLKNSVYANQNALTYWTNFDVWIDWVSLLLIAGALILLGLGAFEFTKSMSEDDDLMMLGLEKEDKKESKEKSNDGDSKKKSKKEKSSDGDSKKKTKKEKSNDGDSKKKSKNKKSSSKKDD